MPRTPHAADAYQAMLDAMRAFALARQASAPPIALATLAEHATQARAHYRAISRRREDSSRRRSARSQLA